MEKVQQPTSSAELTPWPKAADTACAASPSRTTRGAVRRDTRNVLPLVYQGRSANCSAICLRISCMSASAACQYNVNPSADALKTHQMSDAAPLAAPSPLLLLCCSSAAGPGAPLARSGRVPSGW